MGHLWVQEELQSNAEYGGDLWDTYGSMLGIGWA